MFHFLFWCFSFISLSAYSCTFHIVSSVCFCNCAYIFVFRCFCGPLFHIQKKKYLDAIQLHKILWCKRHVNSADGSINLSSFILHTTPFISKGKRNGDHIEKTYFSTYANLVFFVIEWEKNWLKCLNFWLFPLEWQKKDISINNP